MATKEQIETIEKIQKERDAAKLKHISVAKWLSGGCSKYKTAINTMISVGALSVVFSILRIVLTTIEIITFTINGGNWDTLSILLVTFEYAALLTTCILGGKLYILDTTPIFMLVSLIIILVCNVLLFSGIIPLMTAVLSIVGLVCWGTYKNWFNDIDLAAEAKSKKGSKK